jgi:hypothetical protein
MCSHGGIADLVDVSACRSSPNRLLLFELLSFEQRSSVESMVVDGPAVLWYATV